jgi:hypothetical protein
VVGREARLEGWGRGRVTRRAGGTTGRPLGGWFIGEIDSKGYKLMNNTGVDG